MQYEQFQWLAQQIRDFGGDSTLVRAQGIEGLTRDEIVSFFNAARDKDYVDLRKALQNYISRRRKSDAELAAAELKRLTKRFRDLRQIDSFDSPPGHDVAMLLRRAEMIHDADLEDGKFQRVEAIGIDRLFKGWAALYAQLKK